MPANHLTPLLFLPLLIAPALAKPSEGWQLTGAAGLSYADGNSDSLAHSVQVLASYVDEVHATYLGADWFYAEDNGITGTDSLELSAQYNRTLSGKWYAGGRTSYFRDDPATIDYRVDAGLLLGHHLLKGERLKLSLEAGPGYAWQETGGLREDFVTFRFAERFEYRLGETTRLWQTLAYTPRVDDFSDYVLDFELGLETRVTDHWSLRAFVRQRYDGSPAAGQGKSDTAFIFGVAYDLSGLPDPEAGEGRRSLMPEAKETPEPPSGWIATAALGLTLGQGNSDSLAARLAWNQAYHGDRREFFFDLAHTYAESDGVRGTDSTDSRAQYNHLLDERRFVGAGLQYLRDAAADIEYRVTPGLLAGYKLIKTGATTLSFEAGPSYTFEKIGRRSENHISLQVAERFKHAFNSRFSFNQAIVYTAKLADFEDYDIAAIAALDTRLSDTLIWRLGAEYLYESRPAAFRAHHDTSLISSLAVRF